ncbi:MAG TPA: TerC family protein [Nitriliruptoraceae bacterium]|nr:TerC family protein [Nitriliruptoraceae bacterium]
MPVSSLAAPLVLATEAATKFVDLDVMPWEWIALITTIVVLLVADLLLVHRKPHVISLREALIESAVWITIGLAFGLVVWWGFGAAASGEYYAGYLIEKSLSIDNVFVWAVILSYFKVPPQYQFRVLFWGVFGALVLRAIFIFAGVALINRFDWLLVVFGVFLLYTAWKLASPGDHEIDPETSTVLRLVRRVVPTTDELHGQKMFIRRDGHLMATPLFAVLVLIEATDVLFAVDSVPAILAVSQEPFIVFASNAFAILGLRALYFCLGGLKDRFRYLDYGLAAILAFVGVKMLLLNWDIHIPIVVSLGIIFGLLTISIVASLRVPVEPVDESAEDLPGQGAGPRDGPGWEDVGDHHPGPAEHHDADGDAGPTDPDRVAVDPADDADHADADHTDADHTGADHAGADHAGAHHIDGGPTDSEVERAGSGDVRDE